MGLKERFRGALLGTFIGDALGMPVEGMDYKSIEEKFGQVREMLNGRLQKGSYTDDTQMMIGVAESLHKNSGFCGEDMLNCFAENFSAERGYGRSTATIIEEIKKGAKWNEVGEIVFKGGSLGNGAAMRSAPIGLYYYDNLDELITVGKEAAQITHAHRLGYEGAILISLGVAFALKYRSLDEFSAKERFIRSIQKAYPFSKEYLNAFDKILQLLRRRKLSRNEVISNLGVSVKAHESVPVSLYAFLRNSNSFEEAVVYAVNLGGDTDTIGAMTGSLAGAYHGCRMIPERWLNDLEGGEKGKNYVIQLADLLYEKIEI